MTDIDIIPVQRLDFHVADLPWPFAAERRTEIESYFAHLRREKPQLWNGRVLVLRDFEISDATLRGTLFETDYASFIAWRDWGFPDRHVRACFAMGALLSRDGAFLLGVMNAHTAGAGGIYFPAGVPDPGDVVRGRVDFDRNVRREIAEETGLSLEGIAADPWLLVLAPQRVALIKVFRFRKSAADMRASILDHLQKEAYLSFPTCTLFAILPISSRGCLHSSGRSFCIFGIATASDDVRFAQATAWSQLSLRCTI